MENSFFKRALLIIDMIHDFLDEHAPMKVPQARTILPFIKERLEFYRANDWPVVFLSDSHSQEDWEMKLFPLHAIKGTPGAEIIESLKPIYSDIVIEKTTYSGFAGTTLDEMLKKVRVRELEITGCVTEICVFFTAAEAAMRGYKVIIPRQGVAALDEKEGERALEQLQRLFGIQIIIER